MRTFSLLCLVLLISACSSIPVESDYNPAAPFNSYQRYHWQMETSGSDKSVSPFHAQRVRGRLETLLQEQLYQHAGDKEKPDFLLRYYVSELVEGSGRGGNSRGSIGLGSGGGNFGLGVSVGFPLGGKKHPERKLLVIIDVIDRQSSQLSWRGTAEVDAAQSPEDVAEEIEKAVDAIWAEYPPTP